MKAQASKKTDPAMVAQGLTVKLGGVDVLHGLDLALPSACWTCIVGPNGAGKSTLLKALAQLLPQTGQVHLLGQALKHMPARVRAQKLAWLGQGESTDGDFRVRDVVMLGRLPHQTWLAGPQTADHIAVERALRATQAWAWRDRRLRELSGGERQRILLARALAVDSEVLLMDEPLSHLDPPHQADWLAVVQALVASGKTVVSVLHEISMALQAQNLLILREGRVAHQGRCDDPLTHRALEAVFEHRITIQAVGRQWVALPRLLPTVNAPF